MAIKKTTIKDIAQEAKVGIGTVSRVLNNSIHVSEETRKRVLDVVKARQFSPSAAASRLARNDQVDSTVGLLLPDIGNHYFFEIFESIYRKFRGLGIDLIIFNYEKHNPKVIQRVLNAQLSALFIFAFRLDDTERELLQNRNVPYVYVDYPMETEHCIFTDNIEGGRLAARYLLQKGVRNPCYIAVAPPAQANSDRALGFTSELSSAGITNITHYFSHLSEEAGYEIGVTLTKNNKHDGIFCYCDDIATGVLRAVRESQSTIRVIGFDGVRVGRHIGLSTVSQEPEFIGNEAAELLVTVMKAQQEMHIIHQKITPILIDRDS